ncbi:YHYH protein [Winogradskyella sp. R77965]|uniref:YHYH protein n=1 Tax=Winogradskyella sp. R77965 TaxID=3093872 RepID=UPI0037DCB47E
MKNTLIVLLVIVVLGFIACSSNDDGECAESTWYQDLDGDGLGNPNVSESNCSRPDGYVDNDSDRDDDSMPTVYDISSILTLFEGTGLSYAVNGNRVTFTTQDLPNHTSPYWPTNNPLYEAYNGTNANFNQNPNEISAQNITFTITLNPEEATVHEATPMGPIGISRNGVVFFNQYAAGGSPLTSEINSFDQWLGHPAGRDNYHYHIEPTYLTQQFGEDAFLGLLSDGFPVYGPLENGATISSSDLDVYHGHITATEDFPDGIYHYHITADDPYLNGNGFYGTPGNVTN